MKQFTDHQIDAIIAGSKIGRSGKGRRSLDAARQWLTGKATTIREAAEAHGASPQSVQRTARTIIEREERDESGRELVRALVPPQHRQALRQWLARRGGEVIGRGAGD